MNFLKNGERDIFSFKTKQYNYNDISIKRQYPTYLMITAFYCSSTTLVIKWNQFPNFLNCKFSLSAPVRAPGLVTAHNTSSTSLIIKWSHLHWTEFHGKPIGYNLRYQSVSPVSIINCVSLNYTTNTTILTNLTVYTMYVINVSAVSSGGMGPAITVKAATEAGGMVKIKLILLECTHCQQIVFSGTRNTRVP